MRLSISQTQPHNLTLVVYGEPHEQEALQVLAFYLYYLVARLGRHLRGAYRLGTVAPCGVMSACLFGPPRDIRRIERYFTRAVTAWNATPPPATRKPRG